MSSRAQSPPRTSASAADPGVKPEAPEGWTRSLGRVETTSQRTAYMHGALRFWGTGRPRATREPCNLPLCGQENPLDSGSAGCPALASGLPTSKGMLAFPHVTEEARSAKRTSEGPRVSPDLPSFLHLWIHPFGDSTLPVGASARCRAERRGVSKVRVDPGGRRWPLEEG